MKVTWLGHDGFKIEDNGKVLVIDPFQLKHNVLADYVLVSHEHSDHASAEDLKKVVKPRETIVVTISAAKNEVEKASPKEIKIVKPGDEVKLGGFDVQASRIQHQQVPRTGKTISSESRREGRVCREDERRRYDLSHWR